MIIGKRIKEARIKKNMSQEESENLLKKYDEINKFGVPYINARIITGSLAALFIYGVLTII